MLLECTHGEDFNGGRWDRGRTAQADVPGGMDYTWRKGDNAPLGWQSKTTHCPAHRHKCERSQEHSFTSQTVGLFLVHITSLLVLCHTDKENSSLQRASRLLQACLVTACTVLAQPTLEICGLPVGFFLLSPEEKKQRRVNLLILKLREMWHHVQSQRMWAGAIRLPHAALEMQLSPDLQLPGCSCPGLPRSPGSWWVFRSSPQRSGYCTPPVVFPPSTSIERPHGLIPSPLKPRWRQNEKVGKMSVLSTNPHSICNSSSSACVSPRPLPSESHAK